MAVILSIQQLGMSNRNDFYSRIKRSENDKHINQFIDYVKSLKSPIYFLETERPKIENFSDFEKPSYESI